MRVNQAIESSEAKQHTARPCPVCDCITIRQPWASPIALGFKHYEFRSKKFRATAQNTTIRAGSKWESPARHQIVRDHFEQFTSEPEKPLQALFPCSVSGGLGDDCILCLSSRTEPGGPGLRRN